MQKTLLKTLSWTGLYKKVDKSMSQNYQSLAALSGRASILTRGIVGGTTEDPTRFTKRMP
jgi:hypothetical protein